jgi:amino acid adenylation domain-containing protein
VESKTRAPDESLLQQLDGLSPAKRAFVEQRMREARARAASATTIPRIAAGRAAPLSFSQELLWRLEQAAPGTSAYNVPRAMQVRGPLDVARLESALAALVERHAILRTSFVSENDEPRQVVRAARPVALTEISLEGMVASARPDEAKRIILEHARVPFDLANDVLLRATLVRLAPEEHVLLLLSHHIASDGSSGGIMLRDLDYLYRGDDDTLPSLAIQYPDFADWQRAQLTDARVVELLDYWRTRLAGAPARLELPTDRPRPLAPEFGGARRSKLFTRKLADAVHDTARAHSTTPFVVLLAAFEVLLHRYSRQDDIVVGTVVTGRGQQELEGLIGYFSNTLPLRVSFENDPTFSELIGRVRDASLGANEHADLPYETIALELRAGGSTLFDVMFAMIDEGAALGTLGEAVIVPIPLDRGVAKFDLTIGPAFTDEGLRVGIEYRTDLFDDGTIARMLGHYGVVLAAATSAPATKVSRLPLLTSEEREQVVARWNQTSVEYPTDATLVSLLEAQAQKTPSAIAVALASGTDAPLTFAELDARATTLARVLVRRGVSSGVLVGVCMERSRELVVSLVAVLKAGGAYVPLDPEYPADRLAFMIADARCPVLLTQQRVADTVLASLPHEPNAPAVDVLSIDRDWDTIVSDARTPGVSLPEVKPDDLAYMIYTSGSTGKPKGALNRHRGIVNRLLWMQNEYKLTTADSVLQKTPFSFDVSVWEFFLPLLAGARLVMAEPGGHRDPAYLAEVIGAQKITVMHFVPSMLRAFLEEPAAARCGATLRDVMCSGEALPYDLQQRFFGVIGGSVGLHNLYGPTECAVDVSYWACRRDDERRTVPIGRPVANTQLYVLDEAMEPVPIGVAGELYLGGVQVGAGYWGRPDLTSDRFVRDPFADIANSDARLYKTGDLARWLADGVVEYLGRLDFQVKLRGFRIELGEIEAALSAHPGVREVVVVAREDLPGGAALIAYYSARGDTKPTSAELRALLRESLPEYMVPSAFVELETLPLSPSGKVDRKALPVPEELAAVEAVYVAPRTPAEEQVAAIWRDVLHVEQVGVHDDFFDIGGHSLLAMRVAARMHSATGVRIPFRELFTSRTVESLAARVAAASRTEDADAIAPRADTSDAPLSFAQELLWLQAQMSPNAATYNVPMALRINGALDLGRLRSALTMLAERHEALRTSFLEGADGPRQRIASKARANVMEVDLTSWDDDEREEAALTAVRRAALDPFDLTRAPLMRATVVRLAPDDAILLLVVHHIVFDGGSVGILLEELFSVYESGSADALPPVAAQYGDFAAWQRERLSGARMDKLRAFWSAELDGALERVSITKEQDANGSAREGRRVEASIAADALPALRHIGRERDATLYMTLLAAFQTLLHLVSGDDDIVVGSPVSGREQAELERTIGFFANTLPMRARFDDDPSFDALLRRTRDASLRAYENQEMPYEQLLLDRINDRHASDAALFSVLFVQQDDSAGERSLAGARATPVPVALDSAKFDLALSVRDDGDTLHASLHYRADLMKDATAAALLERFNALLDVIAADPLSPVRELEGESSVAERKTTERDASPAEQEYLVPEGPVEEVIAGVWSEMLGRTKVGRNDRFFDVGGHSLLATRIVARVSSLLRARIPIRAFFADPSIRGMAAALVAAEERPGQTTAVARAVLKLRGMSADDRARLAASRSSAPPPDIS